MNAREMLIKRLKELGADGLCCPGARCGCGIDDLAPGWNCIDIDECKAAKWIKPEQDSRDFDCEFPDGYYKVME